MSNETGTDQSIIHTLPAEVSNKIAAGEVVQRPSSVLKELLDNALDSGARNIQVITEKAGRTLIQVIDDGCGMSEHDIPLSFERHATSKIREPEDLYRIRTLGFRGEALASIASVAQVTLKTKRVEDEVGYLYEIWGGEQRKFEPEAVADGTSIAVRNLFYNVPARRSFLKTDATEFRHLLITFQQAALANPEVGFELTADQDKVYQLPPQDMAGRIVEMFGRMYRASLIPVEEQTSYVSIRGYIADPKLTKKSRGEQFLFVNKRPFMHRHLNYVIQDIYGTWIKPNEYPFYALFLDIDPGLIDVNVHPSKLEVKFEDEKSISSLTRSIVKRALNERMQVPDIDAYSERYEADDRSLRSDFEKGFERGSPGAGRTESKQGGGPGEGSAGRDAGQGSGSAGSGQTSLYSGGRPAGRGRSGGRLYADGHRISQDLYASEHGEEPQGEDPARSGGAARQPGRDKSRPEQARAGEFWQLHNQYILSQTLSGFCIIDQHAAHKRIIYEKCLSEAESGLPATQQLLFPQSVEFSASDFALLKKLKPEIERLGFNLQLLSGHTAMINGLPADIQPGDERHLLESILQQYQSLSEGMKLEQRNKLAVALANKTAIPRGRSLSQTEMETLIDQLFSCEQPYQDPMGKATLTYIPLDELKSRFR